MSHLKALFWVEFETRMRPIIKMIFKLAIPKIEIERKENVLRFFVFFLAVRVRIARAISTTDRFRSKTLEASVEVMRVCHCNCVCRSTSSNFGLIEHQSSINRLLIGVP